MALARAGRGPGPRRLHSAVAAVVRRPVRRRGLAKWTPQRFGQLLLGPEQIASYCCFVWAGFILVQRYLDVRRQRRAFGLGLLPTDVGVCILPEDARLLQRKVEQQAAAGGPYILANMIRLALGKYAVSRSGRDVAETVRTQADVDLGRLVSSMATVHYLAWAIPAIGFLGTVRGLATSLTMGGQTQTGDRRVHQGGHRPSQRRLRLHAGGAGPEPGADVPVAFGAARRGGAGHRLPAVLPGTSGRAAVRTRTGARGRCVRSGERGGVSPLILRPSRDAMLNQGADAPRSPSTQWSAS